MALNRKLELMPDTGHHYYFFPLAVQDNPESMSDAYKSIVKGHDIPEFNEKLYEELLKLEPEAHWAPAPERPWMRLKLGRGDLYRLNENGVAADYDRRVEAIGVWLAVETNTGDESRGYRYAENAATAVPEKLGLNAESGVPYAATERQFLNGEQQYDLLELCPTLAEHIKRYIETLPFTVRWLGRVGNRFAVDLIVDFGNSRTVALILEDAKNTTGALSGLNQMCRPLVFSAGHQDAERGIHVSPPSGNCVVDSWFILRQPEFGYTELKPDENAEFSPARFHTEVIFTKGKRGGFFGRLFNRQPEDEVNKVDLRIPHMFVELSPAVIGPGSLRYFSDLGGAAVLCALSSPKRYAWDKTPVGDHGESYWHMMSRPKQDPIQLSGEIIAFMPVKPDDRYYSNSRVEALPTGLMDASPAEWLERPLRHNSPIFPKSDGLIWSALSIIEQAERSINSQAVRVGGAKPRRFLENIVVTFPSGWTHDEIDTYHRAWIYARNVYYWSRYRRDPERNDKENEYPKIKMHIDEAVASQLPVVYSEIRHLGDNLKLWLELFGREREGQNTCRVMSIDIGGGTMDTAVVEYSSAGENLTPRMLFTDSSTRAGDKLVKTIIDEVLIPYIIAKHPDATSRKKLKEALTRRANFADVNKLVAVVKSVFIPIVVRWLTNLSTNQKLDPATNRSHTPDACGVDPVVLADFNSRVFGPGGASVLVFDDPIEIEYNKLEEIVQSWISEIAESHARYLAAFQCDLVIVTGKPSEIKSLRAVLEKELPIEPYRIIFVNGYYAGDWLPLGGMGKDANKIQDAKSVTVVGAALSQAFDRKLLKKLSITKIERGVKPLPNWWYRLNDDGMAVGASLLHPEIDEAEIDVSIDMIIGRVRFPGAEPERVYVFKSRYNQRYGELKAMLKRDLTPPDGGALLSERLDLMWVEGYDEDNRRIERRGSLSEFELELNTLGGNYWLDEPKFELSFED